MSALSPGAPAPEFSLPSTDGTLRLRDFRGRKVVLYFYPSDDTPTCTRQACAFRDALPDYQQAGAVVLGISPDGAESHAKFRRKHKLPFTLLADEAHAVASAYGVWKWKSMFGHRYMGVVRSTFVIDTAGRIAAIFPNVRIKGHVAAVLRAVSACG
jgi:peroxiredoxin Q/BCP